jgi:hypothetical protein
MNSLAELGGYETCCVSDTRRSEPPGAVGSGARVSDCWLLERHVPTPVSLRRSRCFGAAPRRNTGPGQRFGVTSGRHQAHAEDGAIRS